MIRSLAAFALLALATPASAQASDYVLLVSGDTLRGAVDVRSPLLQKTYLAFGDRRVELEEVSEYRSDGETYAIVGTRTIVRRVSSGPRVDFYSRTVTTTTPGVATSAGPGGPVYTPGSVSSETIGYYRLDAGPVERASASNLRLALADNPESLGYLDQEKTLAAAQYATLAAGLAAAAGGAYLSFQQSDESTFRAHPLLIVGVGTAALSNFVFPSQRDRRVRQAIDAYNQ